ncbi:MAG TPA: hypothetical protein PKL57_16320, partial [Candidatus Wallbacteria bacterium]|nr:hypothetical protein [Candidatus Wallbacteria bacterium]
MRLKVFSTGSFSLSEYSKLEVYIGSEQPVVVPLPANVSDFMDSVPANTDLITISGIAAPRFTPRASLKDKSVKRSVNYFPQPPDLSGNKVFYRLVDYVGNSTNWIQDGTIPSPPPAENLYWSNAAITATTGGSTVGLQGETLKAYQNLSATVEYKAQAASPAPAGGYAANTVINFSGTAITSNYSIFYVLANDSGNESNFINGGMVPAAPIEAAAALKLKNNGLNYQAVNLLQSSITLSNTLKIVVRTSVDSQTVDMLIGKASESTIGQDQYIESYAEGKNATSLKTDAINGGTLKFAYINSSGNESSYASDGASPGISDYVPARPESNNILFSNTTNTIKITNSNTGSENDIINVFEYVESTYFKRGYTGGAAVNGFAVNGVYALSGSAPIVDDGNMIAFSLESSYHNESVLRDSAAGPLAPVNTESLRAVYDGQKIYKIKNINESTDFIIPDGKKLNVYINSVYRGSRTASGADVKIDRQGGYSDFAVTPEFNGGNLTFTFVDVATGHESSSVPSTPTMVPPAISYQATIIPANYNGSNNGINFINDSLAQSVVNASAPGPTQQLAVAFTTTASSGNAIFEIINPNDSNKTALLEYPIISSGDQTGQFTLKTGALDTKLKDALGADGGVSFLTTNLWIINAVGNESYSTSASGSIRYDITAPMVSSIIANLSTDGIFTYNVTDKLTITFNENIVASGFALTDIKFPVVNDSFGAGATLGITSNKISVEALGSGTNGIIKVA